MRGRKSKAQKAQEQEEEALSLLEGIAFINWLFEIFKSEEKTKALCRDIEQSGEYMKRAMLILQGKEET